PLQDPLVDITTAKTLEDPWSIMLVASEQAQLMANLAKLINASKTIEIGMYTGYNTLNMALVVPESGQVVACEIDDEYVNIAEPFFKEAGVEDKITVHLQMCIKTLGHLTYISDPPTFSPQVLWSGKVVDPAPDDLTSQALDKLNKKLHTDQRIDLSMLTVGNGLTLAIKRYR
uniref:Catechol-O-methyltransferase domain containing 1 n=1 Tax=Oncorhynchus tshawytscha TaxID=74940 RepID=A0AAZ3PDY8_ONCTS